MELLFVCFRCCIIFHCVICDKVAFFYWYLGCYEFFVFLNDSVESIFVHISWFTCRIVSLECSLMKEGYTLSSPFQACPVLFHGGRTSLSSRWWDLIIPNVPPSHLLVPLPHCSICVSVYMHVKWYITGISLVAKVEHILVLFFFCASHTSFLVKCLFNTYFLLFSFPYWFVYVLYIVCVQILVVAVSYKSHLSDGCLCTHFTVSFDPWRFLGLI